MTDTPTPVHDLDPEFLGAAKVDLGHAIELANDAQRSFIQDPDHMDAMGAADDGSWWYSQEELRGGKAMLTKAEAAFITYMSPLAVNQMACRAREAEAHQTMLEEIIDAQEQQLNDVLNAVEATMATFTDLGMDYVVDIMRLIAVKAMPPALQEEEKQA